MKFTNSTSDPFKIIFICKPTLQTLLAPFFFTKINFQNGCHGYKISFQSSIKLFHQYIRYSVIVHYNMYNNDFF